MERNQKLSLLVLIIAIPFLAYFHLFSGTISITFKEVLETLFHYNSNNPNQIIVHEFRIPRLIIGLIAGGSLAVSGLLMQTLFRNPLSGPYTLGISSGSSILVALTFMGGGMFFTSQYGIITASFIGAFIYGIIILLFSFVVRSYISLLLIGIMLGSFTNSIISILQSISDPTELKMFFMWSMGSLQHLSYNHIPLATILGLIGFIITLFLSKSLNAYTLGEKQASSLGINIKTTRLLIILTVSLLTSITTAFCGPIAFVGLSVPNIVKIIFKTQNHLHLICYTFLMGIVFLLTSDIIIQLLESYLIIPINAITSLIGAPVVIFIVLKKLS